MMTRSFIWAKVTLKLFPGVSTLTLSLYWFFLPSAVLPRLVYSPFRSRIMTGAP